MHDWTAVYKKRGGREKHQRTNKHTVRAPLTPRSQEPILVHERRPSLVQPPMARRQPQIHQLRRRRIMLLLLLWLAERAPEESLLGLLLLLIVLA